MRDVVAADVRHDALIRIPRFDSFIIDLTRFDNLDIILKYKIHRQSSILIIYLLSSFFVRFVSGYYFKKYFKKLRG